MTEPPDRAWHQTLNLPRSRLDAPQRRCCVALEADLLLRGEPPPAGAPMQSDKRLSCRLREWQARLAEKAPPAPAGDWPPAAPKR